jgi:tungstate transport system permease protein
MDYILMGIKEAISLLIGFDKEVYSVVGRSLLVSGIATILSSLYAIPIGIYLGIRELKGRKHISRLIYTSMSIPSVIVGLLVAIILSRRGPLGGLELMYTVKAMIIAQMILLTPLQLGLAYSLARSSGDVIKKTCVTLGGSNFDVVKLIISELKSHLTINIITGFSRAISEVGAVMIVGGNIKGYTRVITTSITMFNSMGEYPMAIALGIVLLVLSFGVNSVVYSYNAED